MKKEFKDKKNQNDCSKLTKPHAVCINTNPDGTPISTTTWLTRNNKIITVKISRKSTPKTYEDIINDFIDSNYYPLLCITECNDNSIDLQLSFLSKKQDDLYNSLIRNDFLENSDDSRILFDNIYTEFCQFIINILGEKIYVIVDQVLNKSDNTNRTFKISSLLHNNLNNIINEDVLKLILKNSFLSIIKKNIFNILGIIVPNKILDEYFDYSHRINNMIYDEYSNIKRIISKPTNSTNDITEHSSLVEFIWENFKVKCQYENSNDNQFIYLSFLDNDKLNDEVAKYINKYTKYNTNKDDEKLIKLVNDIQILFTNLIIETNYELNNISVPNDIDDIMLNIKYTNKMVDTINNTYFNNYYNIKDVFLFSFKNIVYKGGITLYNQYYDKNLLKYCNTLDTLYEEFFKN